MVREWLSKQIRNFRCPPSWFVHHFLLAWDGNRAVDREFGDLPTEVSRHRGRNRGSCQLVLESTRERDVPDLDRGPRLGWHLPSLRRVLIPGARRHFLLGAGDQRAAV